MNHNGQHWSVVITNEEEDSYFKNPVGNLSFSRQNKNTWDQIPPMQLAMHWGHAGSPAVGFVLRLEVLVLGCLGGPWRDTGSPSLASPRTYSGRNKSLWGKPKGNDWVNTRKNYQTSNVFLITLTSHVKHLLEYPALPKRHHNCSEIQLLALGYPSWRKN